MRKEFEKPERDAILLIDAENAYDSLNRDIALKNVEIFYPARHHALVNSYKHPSNLYVKNTVLTSTKGTTQGDPLAMAMYGIGIIPMIELLQNQMSPKYGTQMMEALQMILRVSAHYRTTWMCTERLSDTM